MCFIKLSMFKKSQIGEVLNAILLRCNFELLGIKLVDCKKQIFNDFVPLSIQKMFKEIGYKFYEYENELKIKKKILEFKTLVLVLRGRNVE